MASGYSDLSEIRKNDRTYGVYSKPPKIDLLNERPRRESIVEQQLKGEINRQNPIIIAVQNKQQVYDGMITNSQQPSYSQGSQNIYYSGQQKEQQLQGQNSSPNHYYGGQNYNQQQMSCIFDDNSYSRPIIYNNNNNTNINPSENYYSTNTNSTIIGGVSGSSGIVSKPIIKTVTTTVKTTTSSLSSGLENTMNDERKTQNFSRSPTNSNYNQSTRNSTMEDMFISKQQQQQQPIQSSSNDLNDRNIIYSNLASELAEKEAKLKREIAYLNQHHSPWSRPKQIREPRREPPPKSAKSDQRWIREVPNSQTSRPNSRASSIRSTTTEQDLLEKAEKLLKDVQEIETKPLVTQQILIENGAYRRAGDGQTMGSNADNAKSNSNSPTSSSIHTAIIKVPRGEINNKSPLPFSYDNFSTLGVRGNIASVGAAPPDQPYAPIFPLIKRTPSPTQNSNKHY